jgi:hypothetical protein
MAKFKVVKKTLELSNDDIVYYQINSYCQLNNIYITRSEQSCLYYAIKEVRLSDLINTLIENKVYKSEQSARNTITKLVKLGVLNKSGTIKNRYIFISEEIDIYSDDNLIIDLRLVTYKK